MFQVRKQHSFFLPLLLLLFFWGGGVGWGGWIGWGLSELNCGGRTLWLWWNLHVCVEAAWLSGQHATLAIWRSRVWVLLWPLQCTWIIMWEALPETRCSHTWVAPMSGFANVITSSRSEFIHHVWAETLWHNPDRYFWLSEAKSLSADALSLSILSSPFKRSEWYSPSSSEALSVSQLRETDKLIEQE